MQKTVYRPQLTEHRAQQLAQKEAKRIQRYPAGSLAPEHYQRLNFYNGIILFYARKRNTVVI